MPRLAQKRVVEIDEESSEIAAVETSSAEVANSEALSSETGSSETASSEEMSSEDLSAESSELTEASASEALLEEALLEESLSEETLSTEDSSAEAASLEASELSDEVSSPEAAARKSSSPEYSSAEAPEAQSTETEPSEKTVARPEELRLLEALLFASSEPLDQSALGKRMPDGVNVKEALLQLQADYALRGVNLVRVGSKWSFRTANDLSWLMTRESTETRRLSRAAIEVLAIIAYHQPVTRAEIEDIRGVVTSKGTLDVLLETGWIRPRGRRKTPGRPLTFGTTESFLSQFSLEALGDLPGLEELKGTGLLDSRLPSGFSVPAPSDDPALREDEDPLEPGDLDLSLAPAVEPEPEKPSDE